MALSAIGPAASTAFRILELLFGADWISGALGGPTLESLLGGDVEEATKKIEKRQAREMALAESSERAKAFSTDVASGGMPDPNDFLTAASLLKSGLYEEDFKTTPEESLVNYVSRSLGLSPEELARRTRPPGPLSTLRGR